LEIGICKRGAEEPGFLNPKSFDKKFNFPETGISERTAQAGLITVYRFVI